MALQNYRFSMTWRVDCRNMRRKLAGLLRAFQALAMKERDVDWTFSQTETSTGRNQHLTPSG